MAAIIVSNQSPRITTNYLNQLGRVGDPAPGVPVSTAQVSGSIVQPYGGMLGGKLSIANPEARSMADPAVGPLYGGIYMYVRFLPTSTAANARGQLVFWSDPDHYVVSPDYSSSAAAQIAGVSLNSTARGNYDFVQIAGEASVKFGSITGPGGIGYAVILLGGTNTADVPSQTTAPEWNVLKLFIGISTRTAPAAQEVSTVRLNFLGGWEY